MFDKSKVITKLNGVVGWRQPLDPALPTLDASNLASISSYYFDENPFVKIKTILENNDFADISDAQFNTYLSELQDTSIANVLNAVFAEVDYIDRQVLYKFPNNKINPETMPTGFVGYEIVLSDKKDIAFEISRIFLEFQGTGDIKLLLFNSSKEDPILTKDVTISSTMQEVELNWIVNNTDGFYKGRYYIGYISDSLDVTPFDRDYENSNIQSVITDVCVTPIEVVDHTAETLFDLNDIDNVSETWGMNFDMTVYDDYTDLIIQNKSLFAKAIQLQGQLDSLSGYLASIRSNRTERRSDNFMTELMIEIEGLDGDIKKSGIRKALWGQIGHLKKEVQKLRKGYFTYGFEMNTRS